jgi:hypothetical protein
MAQLAYLARLSLTSCLQDWKLGFNSILAHMESMRPHPFFLSVFLMSQAFERLGKPKDPARENKR